MSFWTRSEQFPPILIRLLAKWRHGGPMTDTEIAERAGLPVGTVLILGQCTAWDGIDIPTARKFMLGCGFDIEKRSEYKRVTAYLQKRPVTWQYLRKSPWWKDYFQPMMLRYLKSRRAKT